MGKKAIKGGKGPLPHLRQRTTRSSRGRLLAPTPSVSLPDQLRLLGLYAAPTLGDGNCLFRALADQVYGSPVRHGEVRREVCDWIERWGERYEGFVEFEGDDDDSVSARRGGSKDKGKGKSKEGAEGGEAPKEEGKGISKRLAAYLRNMRQNGTYGGHMELSAFAHMTRRDVKVVQPGLVYVIEWRAGSGGSGSSTSTSVPESQAKEGEGAAAVKQEPTRAAEESSKSVSAANALSASTASTRRATRSVSASQSASPGKVPPKDRDEGKTKIRTGRHGYYVLEEVSSDEEDVVPELCYVGGSQRVERVASEDKLEEKEVEKLVEPKPSPAPSKIEEVIKQEEEESGGPTVYVAYHDWEHFSSIRNLRGPHTGLPNIQETPAHSHPSYVAPVSSASQDTPAPSKEALKEREREKKREKKEKEKERERERREKAKGALSLKVKLKLPPASAAGSPAPPSLEADASAASASLSAPPMGMSAPVVGAPAVAHDPMTIPLPTSRSASPFPASSLSASSASTSTSISASSLPHAPSLSHPQLQALQSPPHPQLGLHARHMALLHAASSPSSALARSQQHQQHPQHHRSPKRSFDESSASGADEKDGSGADTEAKRSRRRVGSLSGGVRSSADCENEGEGGESMEVDGEGEGEAGTPGLSAPGSSSSETSSEVVSEEEGDDQEGGALSALSSVSPSPPPEIDIVNEDIEEETAAPPPPSQPHTPSGKTPKSRKGTPVSRNAYTPGGKELTRRQRKALGLPKPRRVGGGSVSAGKIVIPGGRWTGREMPPGVGVAGADADAVDAEEEWRRNGTGRLDVRGFRELKI